MLMCGAGDNPKPAAGEVAAGEHGDHLADVEAQTREIFGLMRDFDDTGVAPCVCE